MVPWIEPEALWRRYDAVLLDAYGVLVRQDGPIEGAVAFLEALKATGKAYFILTNDASRLPETIADRFAGFGLDVPPARIITSGSLLAAHFAAKRLQGERCVVLGPEGSLAYAERAGGIVVPATDEKASVVVIGDEMGFPLLETLDDVLTLLLRRLDAGQDVHLVLPNPDLIYPKSQDRYGLTSGSLALMLEATLHARYQERPDLRFEPLGKPYAPIFQEALRRTGTRKMVMVGDQLATDILGAQRFGIDSVLVGTGLTRFAGEGPVVAMDPSPTFIMQALA